MSTTGWAVTILALIILLGGGWWYFSSQAPVPADTTVNVGANAAGTIPEGTQTPDNGMVGADASAGAGATTGVTVHYTASGFSPKNVTINTGQKVTFINDTSGPMWVASGQHPVHAQYDGTDRETHCSGAYTGPTPFDQCQPGSTYTFVFTKAGTFDFHNHSAAQFGGVVTVK